MQRHMSAGLTRQAYTNSLYEPCQLLRIRYYARMRHRFGQFVFVAGLKGSRTACSARHRAVVATVADVGRSPCFRGYCLKCHGLSGRHVLRPER
jgi:hypothetical protein